MLDHILGRMQSFEKRHGVTPNVVYINHSHYQVLRQQCPGLFADTVTHHLGFHLILVSDIELVHPRIGWIPPRVQVGADADVAKPASVHRLHHRRAS